jgi:hypothetical protein
MKERSKIPMPRNLMLVQEKSIKNWKKTFLRNIKMFWFNGIGFSSKMKKIVGITPYALRKFPEIHDGCCRSAPLTWELLSSTPLPCLPEWRLRNGGFLQHLLHFYKGLMTKVIHDVDTKLTVIFLDRAGLVEKTEQPITGFIDMRCIPNMIIYSPK